MVRFKSGLVSMVAAAMLLASPALADFDAGVAAYQAGNIDTAVEEWKAASDAGNETASYLLGHLYKTGNGVTQSDRLAIPYFLRSAQAGNPNAQVEMALIYFHGSDEADVDRDYQEAARWFDQAALQRNAEAQYYLGLMHRQGLGMNRDRTEGLRWFMLSANKAFVPTFLELASIYAKGDGVAENPAKAAMYLDLARRFVDPQLASVVNEDADKLARYINGDERSAGLLEAEQWMRAYQQRAANQ